MRNSGHGTVMLAVQRDYYLCKIRKTYSFLSSLIRFNKGIGNEKGIILSL
jgi:hypothetical protein